MLPVLEAIFGKMQSDLKFHPVLGKSSMTVTDCIVRPGALSIIPDSCEMTRCARSASPPGQSTGSSGRTGA